MTVPAIGNPIITGEPCALGFEHVDHAQQMRVHRAGDGVTRSLPLHEAVAAQPGTLGDLFTGEADQNAGGMKLRTSDANQRHGENLHARGVRKQRQ